MLQAETVVNEKFRRIGQGFCGTVWTTSTGSADTYAIKREDGGPGRSLFNDYNMHKIILENLTVSQTRISVPGCHQYVSSDDRTWWNERISGFPKDFQVPCNALVTDRIVPFPQAVRDFLIDAYCAEPLRSSIKISEPDQDCLIRPYLGRRRRIAKQSKFHGFSLRNYPLHIDQIEELALDGAVYARIMAETLADLYWRAQVDANDIEFVLAPLKDAQTIQIEERSAHDTTIRSQILGEHVVWILDFDCCKHMALNETGVQQAVDAFYRNDPFYPRPGRHNIKDQALWSEFRYRFLEASSAIFSQGSPAARLPVLWVDSVEQRGCL
ncbi:hypothetical protein MMC19_005882 [Ptychographa xylographoides]|nr:hypothetical protein [Ptychographa xylographoides]